MIKSCLIKIAVIILKTEVCNEIGNSLYSTKKSQEFKNIVLTIFKKIIINN